ncbi:metallophosphoesterase family protein [Jatrophihabitans fulvus]
MTTPLDISPDVIAIAGDWHGNLHRALEVVGVAHEHSAPVVVQVGDFGFWRAGPSTDRYISRINRRLADYGMHLMWVDGNHEDHHRLARLPVDGATGLRKITNRIWHIPRGARFTWRGYSWMGLGGAASVDRRRRTPGRDWWPEETLSDADVEHASRPGDVDVMICHDAPAGVRIPGIDGPSVWPREDIARSRLNRAQLRRVVDAVQPAALYHGHYHVRTVDRLEHSAGTTTVRGLAADDSTLSDNVMLIDPSGLPLPPDQGVTG